MLGIFDCGMDVCRRNQLEIVGSDGTIDVPFPWQTPLGAGFAITRDGEPEHVTPETVDPYGRELDEMGRAIAGGDPPRLGRANAVGQARTIEALYRAADTGTSVSL